MTLNYTTKKETKQRLTAFVDPALVKRIKVRGALEGLTLSQAVEKALEDYAPSIENDSDNRIHLTFRKTPNSPLISDSDKEAGLKVPKHTKALVVPR